MLRAIYAHVIYEYKAGVSIKAGEAVPCYKLMSGSSLGWRVKGFLRSHKTLISKAFYFRSCSTVALNFVFLKPTNKDFTYV